MQLSLLASQQLSPASPRRWPTRAQIVGSWHGGERTVVLGQRHAAASVWLHFLDDGRALLTLRHHSAGAPLTAVGHWRLRDAELSLRLGSSEIRSTASYDRGVLRWAEERLVRLPDGVSPLGHLRPWSE